MKGLTYLDVPQLQEEEREQVCLSHKMSPDSLLTLGRFYQLSEVLDEAKGFKRGELPDLRDYLDRIEGPVSQFQTTNRDIITGARTALHLAAFDDAKQGLIWPLQDKAPYKTLYSHPWEHRMPWNDRHPTYYPAIRPTGVVLDYKMEEYIQPTLDNLAGGWVRRELNRPLQRRFDVGMEGLRYKTKEVSKGALAGGLRTIADTFRVVRETNEEILRYYFNHRLELRALVREHFNPERPWESWRPRLALHERLDSELRERGPIWERFVFQASTGLFINLEGDRSADAAHEYLKDLERGDIYDALLYFAGIDLSLSADVPEIEQGMAHNMASSDDERQRFRKCYEDYAAYLGKHQAALDGFGYPFHGPRRLYEYEIYGLLVHLILFESHDLMEPKDYNPHDVDRHYAGQRYIYIEDLAGKVAEMGIDFRYLETLVVELNQYFRSLGLMVVRRSGERDVYKDLVPSWERINQQFRINPVFTQRDLTRARILTQVPFR